jgi:hypothetical protein
MRKLVTLEISFNNTAMNYGASTHFKRQNTNRTRQIAACKHDAIRQHDTIFQFSLTDNFVP